MARKVAISCYLNGTSIKGTQKVIELSFNIKLSYSVLENWLKNANKILEEKLKERQKLEKSRTIEMLEMNEAQSRTDDCLQTISNLSVGEVPTERSEGDII